MTAAARGRSRPGPRPDTPPTPTPEAAPEAAPAPAPAPAITIRLATAADADAVADVYLASFHATYDFPLAHTDDDVRRWIATVLIAAGGTWLAEVPGAVVGMMTLDRGDLDQLYVAPDRLGQGIGRSLLDHAKRLSPEGLSLFTFQVNERARRFYERNGFAAEWFGDGSANEERQPDVRYAWRPTPAER